MTGWLVPRSDLSAEQIRAVELPPTRNRVVIGGPGSGKTQMLVHRAHHLRETMGAHPDRYRILVFTKALSSYLASALDVLGIPQDRVGTFDSWCMGLHSSRRLGALPWDSTTRRPDFAAIREQVARDLRLSSPSPKPYDFLLVDEGQDLDPPCFEILAALSDHVTVCMDSKQRVYAAGSDPAQVLKALGARSRQFALLETFRSCPDVVRLAAALIEERAEREAYLLQNRTRQTERLPPLLRVFRTPDQERRELIEVLRGRLALGERVGVLLPRRRQAEGYAKALERAGIRVEGPKRLDFDTDRPKVMPYHGAKGLTFDSVLLPGLVSDSFGGLGETHLRAVLFVGVTRALRWVYMSTTEKAFPLVGWLRPLAAAGAVTVQRGGTATKTTADRRSKVAAPLDDLAGLL